MSMLPLPRMRCSDRADLVCLVCLRLLRLLQHQRHLRHLRHQSGSMPVIFSPLQQYEGVSLPVQVEQHVAAHLASGWQVTLWLAGHPLTIW